MQTDLVIGILVVIVVLLCTPLKHRADLVRSLIPWAALIVAANYFLPPLLGWLAPPVGYYYRHFGRVGRLLVIGGSGCAIMFYSIWKADRLENEAIRSGSPEAFKRRVEAYERSSFNYNHNKAVEAALRIKEGK